MSARARLFVLFLGLATVPRSAVAQAQWQPSPPPLVTADHETWFQAGDPLIWAGDYYYPSGARQFFNGNQMVRAGSFRGIPLYTDATREPFSIVLVPVSGGLMQPYERRRSGALAGTSGATAPSFPPDIAGEGLSAERGAAVDIAVTPGPPARARAYDLEAPVDQQTAAPGIAGTAGRVMTSIAPLREVARPSRATAGKIWVTYDGQRWFANGVPMTVRPGDLAERGTYHGFPVFSRKDDPDTIYIPTVHGGLLTPFRLATRR